MSYKHILSLLFLLIPFYIHAQGISAYELSKEMIEKTMSIDEMYFEMKKTERIDGEYLSESFRTKLQTDPFQLYSKKIETGKTPELLYKDGWNDNKALINPDGFPWFNLSLEPTSSFMRRNQHHTLHETGYRYAVSILKYLFDKYGDEVEEMSSYNPTQMINGVDCWVIQFDNKHFKTIEYTVLENENVVDIAKRYKLSEFKILEYNKEIDDFDDVKAGQVIKINNDYSPKMIMAIDKNRIIPISIKVFDEFGLFEQYEYTNVKLSPGFSDDEFTEDYPGYGF